MENTEFLKATLNDESTNVEIKYQVSIFRTKKHGWRGEFFTDCSIEPGEYELVAHDGRRGTVFVKRVYPGHHNASARCIFEGIGEFGK